MSTTSTFGAPAGGRSGTIGGYFVSGSFASYVVSPTGVTSGMGNTSRMRVSLTLVIGRAPLRLVVRGLIGASGSWGNERAMTIGRKSNANGGNARLATAERRDG